VASGLLCLCGSWLSPSICRADEAGDTAPAGSLPPGPAGDVEPPAAAKDAGDAAPPDKATSNDARREAGQRFDRGLELYAEGDYALASIEFKRAYELVPNYRVLYNIGQVGLQLGNYADARRALEQYVEKGGDALDDERKQAVMRDLMSLERRTAFLTVTANVAGAEVLVDDVAVARAQLGQPLLVDAGVHRVTVRRSGYLPSTKRVTLAGGDEELLSVTLDARPDEKQTIVVRQAAPKDNTLMIAGWVTTGALAAGAIVTGIMGAGEASELQQLKRARDVEDLANRLDAAQSNARSLLLASDVFSGAAVVVGGLSLWVTTGPTPR
jgi:tetratricopeptide (TPR) repeat protein